MPDDEPKQRILVIEDEAMISMLIEEMVLDSGAEIVGPLATFSEAMDAAREAEFTVAVLDLNLNGTLSYPIADVIRERGIPIIFATGYDADGLLERFRGCQTLQKPFSQNDFMKAVAASYGFPLSDGGRAYAGVFPPLNRKNQSPL